MEDNEIIMMNSFRLQWSGKRNYKCTGTYLSHLLSSSTRYLCSLCRQSFSSLWVWWYIFLSASNKSCSAPVRLWWGNPCIVQLHWAPGLPVCPARLSANANDNKRCNTDVFNVKESPLSIRKSVRRPASSEPGNGRVQSIPTVPSYKVSPDWVYKKRASLTKLNSSVSKYNHHNLAASNLTERQGKLA